MRFGLLRGVLPAAALFYAAAPGPNQEARCAPERQPVKLPHALDETSGAAFSLRDPTIIWTHNDSGNPAELTALDLDGDRRATVSLDANNRDWEALDRGRCLGGPCLYIADTGDNGLSHEQLDLYRLPEPELTERDRIEPERFRMRLPDGPRNIEAMFVLPGEQVFFVSKGSRHPVTVYRYPGPLNADSVVVLEEVQRLTDGPQPLHGMVTGASASEDGGLVAVRRYRSLEFFTFDRGRLQPIENGALSLDALPEAQGEAVALGPDGRVVLTSERDGSTRAVMNVLHCELVIG